MWDFSKGYRIFQSSTPGSFKVMAYFKNKWVKSGWKELHLTQNLIAYDVIFEVDRVMKKRFFRYKTFHAFALAKKIEVVGISDLESIDTSDYKEITYNPKKFHHFIEIETDKPVLKASSVILSLGKIKYK
tara:strand:+ start:405 stop:794 length:390 start_codon:yes stop_codon:yes gene_type:complete